MLVGGVCGGPRALPAEVVQTLAQQHPLSRGDLLVADAALQHLLVGHQHLLL